MAHFEWVYLKAPVNMANVRLADGCEYLADANGFMKVRPEHVVPLLERKVGFEYHLDFQPKAAREHILARRAAAQAAQAMPAVKQNVPVDVAVEG